MQNQLYTKSDVCHHQTKTNEPTPLARTMSVLMLNGVEARVLGQAPMPAHKVVVSGWTICPWSNDQSTLPAGAGKALVGVYQAQITPLNVFILHEPRPTKPKALETIRQNLPHVDTAKVGEGIRNAGATLARQATKLPSLVDQIPMPNLNRVSQVAQGVGEVAVPVAKATGMLTGKLAIATTMIAGKVAWESAKVAGKVTVALARGFGVAALGLGGLVVGAMMIDPILAITVPADKSVDDGSGDPVWIEIYRWYEE